MAKRSDWITTDPKTGIEKDRDSAEEFIVLFKQKGGREFRPMFHSQFLSKDPGVMTDPATGRPTKVWDSTAGAVEYIREHQAGQDGGDYLIKNRKGKIV